MAADTMRKIFDPYFTTKGELGTGLGLPQIWSYMQLAGGYVTAESAPGKGSTFDLLFPTGNEEARDDVWAQMERWVNEGSAAGETIYRNAPVVPPRQHVNHCFLVKGNAGRGRSDERRVGKERVSACRSRRSTYLEKNKRRYKNE